MEKHVKKIADELTNIRKALEKQNDNHVNVMQVAEPIMSEADMIKKVVDHIKERVDKIS